MSRMVALCALALTCAGWPGTSAKSAAPKLPNPHPHPPEPVHLRGAATTCNASTFGHNLTDTECWGLTGKTADPMGNPIRSAQDCMATCCALETCSVWNYKASSAAAPCWLWLKAGEPAPCRPVAGWLGGGGRSTPPAPPPPPASTTIWATINASAVPSQALPFQFEHPVGPDGQVYTADSVSFLSSAAGGAPLRRTYPIAGEVQLARLPASQWREELLRMRAGGLNGISVYVFWVHHEERQGVFTFDGRRSVRAFFQIAKELGLHALARIGPWDHGECRNGGHPDWVLQKCGQLRTTDPTYLACVKPFFAALAEQLKGLYWKDGGPIVGVQLDNETTDWKYLLALKQMAMSVGILPAYFAKTGWPGPQAGYPADYPMLPYYGGYSDNFWNNAMVPAVSKSEYLFNSAPTLLAPSSPDWIVPPGYPWVDVEIGGGMAAAYNHRTHMESDDMPAMHLCDIGGGVNALGYYLFHGGNNPHSLIYTADRDAPNTTLQESSFQPAGAQNPMPSESYDFFAPLGEFGQIRSHFHSMRRLHLMLLTFGDVMAATSRTYPLVTPSGTSDNTTVRWVLRTNGSDAGYLFVNNYQRLDTLSPKPLVRFGLNYTDGSSITVPWGGSAPVEIPSGVWQVWPVRHPMLPAAARGSGGDDPVLEWATAQLVTALSDDSAKEATLFLLESAGAAPELGVRLHAAKVTAHAGNLTQDGDIVVLHGFAPGPSSVLSLDVGGRTLHVVVLPVATQDALWLPTLGGTQRLVVSTNLALVAGDGNALRLRAEFESPCPTRPQPTVSVYPPIKARPAPVATSTSTDGVFSNTSVPLACPHLQAPSVKLVRAAGPPRDVPLIYSKAREPNRTEWEAAAQYEVRLNLAGMTNLTELRLAFEYDGDSARVYFGDRLLTDNWYSGYRGQGQLEVGISYLAAENPGLLVDGAVLQVLVMPIKRATLEKHIFLQQRYWPAFTNGTDVACALTAVRPVGYQYLSLEV